MYAPYIRTYLHSGIIRNITVTVIQLNDTSVTVTWTLSDTSYSYKVIWTNLNTGVTDSFIVPGNVYSYNVTGLNNNSTYNVSVTAMGACGMRTSDPVTVDGKCT